MVSENKEFLIFRKFSLFSGCKSLKSQFIVKCFHTRVGKWANGEKLALLEYVPGGDMFTLLKKLKRLTNAQTKFYSGQVILGQFKKKKILF